MDCQSLMASTHWHDFLRSGALASCPTAANGTYDEELEQGWRDFFVALPEGVRILDVGTGNGPILLIAKRVSEQHTKRFQLYGADREDIDPVRYVRGPKNQYDGIVFHGRSPTESLGLPENAFDVVTGQYALEYGAPKESIAEIARVLRPSGWARFVVHHEESVVVANARQAIEYSQWILQDLKMAEQLAVVPHSHVIRVTIEAVQNLLDVRRQVPAGALNQEVLAKRQALESAVVRMQDLLAHACTATHIDQLEQHARQIGFDVSPRSLQHHQSNLVGWILEWRLRP
jgi:ubiquinone/menaquinone biosynthesis C-methylase UbiE